LSRRRIRRAIDDGGVYVNRHRCRRANRCLQANEQLRIIILEGEQLRPFSPNQLYWYENHLYLVHKRSGQYAQKALHHSRGTLPDELADHLKLPPVQRKMLRPVLRLDRGTSGLLLFCDDPALLHRIQVHWADCVEKQYLAVVEPGPAWQKECIQLPISRQTDALGCYRIEKTERNCDTQAEVVEEAGTGSSCAAYRPYTSAARTSGNMWPPHPWRYALWRHSASTPDVACTPALRAACDAADSTHLAG